MNMVSKLKASEYFIATFKEEMNPLFNSQCVLVNFVLKKCGNF